MENHQKERLICKACGKQEEVNECGNYFLQFRPLNPVTRKSNSLFPIPRKYSHYIYGGYGSSFDWTIFFFTAEQAEHAPQIMCDDCFKKFFAGQKLRSMNNMEPREGLSWTIIEKCQNCGQTKDRALYEKGGDVYLIKPLTKKMRQRFHVPEDYQSYLEAFNLFNYRIRKGIQTGNIYLLKKMVTKTEALCSFCLHQKIKGQIIMVIDFNRSEKRTFRVK